MTHTRSIRLVSLVLALMLLISVPAMAKVDPKEITRITTNKSDIVLIVGQKTTFYVEAYSNSIGKDRFMPKIRAAGEFLTISSKTKGSKRIYTIKAIKAGSTSMTFQAVREDDTEIEGVSATVRVTIYDKKPPAPESLTLSESEVTLIKGKKLKLTASVAPYHPKRKKITWKSLNKKVASISANGKITAKKPGEAIIEGSIKGYPMLTQTCVVTVQPKGYVAPDTSPDPGDGDLVPKPDDE